MRECVLEKVGGLELGELVSSEEVFVLKTGIYLELRGNYTIKNASKDKYPQRTFATHQKNKLRRVQRL
jgi:hypothetical protein